MTNDFEDKLKYARTYMLLWAPFFGSLTMNIEIDEREYPNRTVWTNGVKVFFDSTYVKNITREEFAAVLMHQVLHIALLHQKRNKGRNKLNWNLACDYVINLIIKEEQLKSNNKIRLPKSALIDTKYEKLSVEQVFNKLPKNIDIPGYNAEFLQHDNTILFDLLQEEEFLNGDAEIRINDMLNYASSVAMSQGTLPSGLVREINTILYPKVDWRILLKEFIQAYPADWDFSNRDRRFMNTPFFLPQFSGEVVKIHVAIDTSGSISKETLSAFMTETYAILSAFDRVEMTLLCVDAKLQNIQKIHSLDDALNFKMKGGGGTDFRDTFKYLEDSNSCDGLIFFTDLYATFPDNEPHFKTLWIAISDKTAPFGKTIKY